MACNNNYNQNPLYWYNAQSMCNTTGSSLDSSNIMYSGPNLENIDIDTNSTVQAILEAINTSIGTISGIDWSSFDYACLPDYTTVEQFAEGISTYICNLNTTLTTFIGTTYAADKAAMNTSITSIDEPGLTSCASVGVIDTDNTTAILTKILSNLCDVNETLELGGIDWNNCYTVSPIPTNIIDAFTVINEQICDLKNNPTEPTYPTFNNSTNCLEGTTTDSLYDTIISITGILCSLPTFDIGDIAWTTCISNPNPGGGADITSALNKLVSILDPTYKARVVQFDPAIFDVTYSTPGNQCSGQVVTLQDDVEFTDRLVALDGTDTDPDYLLNKMTAGTLITFDTATSPGTVIINSSAEDNKVKANAADTSSDYLINKIHGLPDSTSALSLVESYNAGTDKVDLTPTIDYAVLTQKILDTLSINADLLSQLCVLNCQCPSCDGLSRTISFVTTNINADGYQPDFHFTGSQNSPTLAWYATGNIVNLSNIGSLTSGSFVVTSTAVPLYGSITLTNDDAVTITYHIYVKDGTGTIISDASNITSTLAASGTLSNTSFNLGTSPNGVYTMHIDIDDAT
jgi:hypothetical protein